MSKELFRLDTRNATERNPKSLSGRLSWPVGDLAVAVGVSPGLIRAEIARGNLRATRIGKRIIIQTAAIETWLARPFE
jgi:excisionase family DNA binding protein